MSQVSRSKKRSISPRSSSVAIQPPTRAPRMPIAVVPMHPPGSVRPGISARAMAPANSPRRIQLRKPISPDYPSDLEEPTVGAEVRHLGRADRRPRPPALVDVAADRERWIDAL